MSSSCFVVFAIWDSNPRWNIEISFEIIIRLLNKRQQTQEQVELPQVKKRNTEKPLVHPGSGNTRNIFNKCRMVPHIVAALPSGTARHASFKLSFRHSRQGYNFWNPFFFLYMHQDKDQKKVKERKRKNDLSLVSTWPNQQVL